MYTFYNVYCYLQLLFSMVRCVLVINMYCLDVKTDIIKMLQFLIDNIFIMFRGRDYQQILGIPLNLSYCISQLVLHILSVLVFFLLYATWLKQVTRNEIMMIPALY